jgi:hypothetical protein
LEELFSSSTFFMSLHEFKGSFTGKCLPFIGTVFYKAYSDYAFSMHEKEKSASGCGHIDVKSKKKVYSVSGFLMKLVAVRWEPSMEIALWIEGNGWVPKEDDSTRPDQQISQYRANLHLRKIYVQENVADEFARGCGAGEKAQRGKRVERGCGCGSSGGRSGRKVEVHVADALAKGASIPPNGRKKDARIGPSCRLRSVGSRRAV